jgi:Flp pilus assembly protein protease CpaA
VNTLSYWVTLLPWIVAVFGVGVCAAYDLRYRRVPNVVLFAMLTLACGLGASHSLLGGSVYPLLRFVAGGLLVGLVPLVLWRIRLMGAGDVKLCAVLGALVGAKFGLLCTSAAFTLGLIWLIFKAAFHGSPPWRSWFAGVTLVAARSAFVSGVLRRTLVLAQPSVAQTTPFAPALVASVWGVAALVWITGWRA